MKRTTLNSIPITSNLEEEKTLNQIQIWQLERDRNWPKIYFEMRHSDQALFDYIEQNDIASVQSLLDRYALNFQDNTHLMHALKKEHTTIVNIILKEIKSRQAASILALEKEDPNALKKGLHADIIKVLLQKVKPIEAFFYYIQVGDLKSVKNLLKLYNFNLNEITIDNRIKGRIETTPLIHACTNGQLEVVNFLLKQKADPNKRENGVGWMALAAVASITSTGDHVSIVKTLLDHKAEVDASVSSYSYFNYKTALTLALSISQGSTSLAASNKTIKILLEYGAEVNNLKGFPDNNHLYLAITNKRFAALSHFDKSNVILHINLNEILAKSHENPQAIYEGIVIASELSHTNLPRTLAQIVWDYYIDVTVVPPILFSAVQDEKNKNSKNNKSREPNRLPLPITQRIQQ